jgi:hypothetical protein
MSVRALLVAASVGTLVAACAGTPAVVPGEPKSVARQALAPYDVHEDCMELAPGDRLDYRFESSEPVAFNVHYHDGKMVVMPITRDAVTADSGVYAPKLRQGYCLMWEAGAAGATLAYRYVVRRVIP